MKTNKLRVIHTLLLIILLGLFSTKLSSENTMKQLTNLNGLSNNSVNCIFEDSDNIIWFGTWDGLNSYNGRDFKVYRYSNDNQSLSNNVIRQIVEADSLYLWISTDYGINRWNKKEQNFTPYYLGTEKIRPKQEKAYLIGKTSHNDIISYVRDRGLFYFDQQKESFEAIEGFSPDKNIKSFIIDDEDHIILLHDNGILEQYSLKTSNGIPTLTHYKIIEQNNSVINIFENNNTLIIYYPEYIKIIDKKNSYPTTIDIDKNKTISDILYRDGYLLLSYTEGGCDKYDLNKKTYTPLSQFPQNISIFSMYFGSQDILWIGTDGQGVWQVYEYHSPFNTVRTNHPVRSFCELGSEQLLIGTKGDGIKVYNKQNRELSNYMNLRDGLISNSVYTMKKNESGDIFVGTEGQGLNIISDNKIYRLSLPYNSPLFKSIYSILFTNNESCLWLGTSGFGLIKIELSKENGRYKAKNVKQYSSSTETKSINNNIIYSVIEGANPNELWLGTRGGGLFLFDIISETFTNIDDIDSHFQLTNNDILCLSKDANSLWIGTSYGLNGLSLNNLAIASSNIYTEKQGIANNTIHGVLSANETNLWISTNLGLSHINTESRNITNYSVKDGLQNDEFSDGAYYKDSNGLLYFGGVSGFNYFTPDEISLRSFEPKITLSNLKIFNTPVNIFDRIHDNTLKLSYDDAYVTFAFIAQDYINNENCEYSYRLINFSDEWINNGQSANIVLTKLPPGKYELQVKASNGDRIWGKDIYTLHIDVASPWWLSIPAIIIYSILIIIIIYTIYSVIRNRIRMNRQLLLEHVEKENQKKIHESKLNFFTNVAHEFFTPLTLIYGPAQHILDKADIDSYTKRYIQVIKNNADRMQKLINELMDFRKVESGHAPLHPEKIDIKLLIDYISDNYTEIAEETKIDFSIRTKNISTITTDRNSIEKIMFNLISNAFKYTPANGYIQVNISQENDILNVIIKNSGKGLTQKQMSEIFNKFKVFETPQIQQARSTGIGLSLVKSLTELLGGSIAVDSRLKEFVEFSVKIPSIHTSIEDNEMEDADNGGFIGSNIQAQKNISILIVEDEKNIRELLKDILDPYYNVNEAVDGEKALSTIAMNTPDIIISDILMPNLDGIGLIEKLKADPTTAHIPIINISAKNSLEDHINAYQHGADLYITKPFHPRHVLTIVQNLINKQSQLKNYFTSSLSSISIRDGIELHQEDENLLQEIISFIEKNIDDESLSPNSIADALGLSKATLYRKLKELADKTPSEFVRSIRLNYASHLLKSSKMTVQEIMFKAGFSNKSYFYREFAKQYNFTPSEYRKINSK